MNLKILHLYKPETIKYIWNKKGKGSPILLQKNILSPNLSYDRFIEKDFVILCHGYDVFVWYHICFAI